MSMLEIEDLRVIAAGLDHPEGVAVDADGAIWCGGEGGQLYRVDAAAGTFEQFADTGGFCLGVACDAAGGVYVCNAAERPAVLRFDTATGSLDTYCDSADGGPLVLPNWAAFAADGTLWCTDSGVEAIGAFDGRILAIPPGGGDAAVASAEPLHFPNGLCIAADGGVYFVDTLAPGLFRLVDGRAEEIAALPGHSPDGVVACADGGFVIACYYPFRLLHVPAGGATFEVLLDDVTGIHLPMPTNAAYLTDGGTEVVLGSLGGQALTAIDLGMPGLPLHRPG